MNTSHPPLHFHSLFQGTIDSSISPSSMQIRLLNRSLSSTLSNRNIFLVFSISLLLPFEVEARHRSSCSNLPLRQETCLTPNMPARPEVELDLMTPLLVATKRLVAKKISAVAMTNLYPVAKVRAPSYRVQKKKEKKKRTKIKPRKATKKSIFSLL